jgi:hypothetical protein
MEPRREAHESEGEQCEQRAHHEGIGANNDRIVEVNRSQHLAD